MTDAALRYRRHDEGSSGEERSHGHHPVVHMVDIDGNGEQKDGHHTHAVGAHHAPGKDANGIPCFPGIPGFTNTALPTSKAPPQAIIVHQVRLLPVGAVLDIVCNRTGFYTASATWALERAWRASESQRTSERAQWAQK